jgi:hypothetical protein
MMHNHILNELIPQTKHQLSSFKCHGGSISGSPSALAAVLWRRPCEYATQFELSDRRTA